MIVPSNSAFQRNELARAIGLYLIGWIILSWPWLSGQFTVPWDAKAHFYPQFAFLARVLQYGNIPYWNPYIFAGTPQISDPQSLIFSLPHFLVAFFNHDPSMVLFDAIAFGMLGCGGIAIILLFHDKRWHWLGGLVAALAFSHGGSAAWRIQHTGQVLSLSWFMITYWVLNRTLRHNSLLAGFFAGFCAAMMVLGRDQIALMGLYLLTIKVLFHYGLSDDRPTTIKKSLPPLLVGAVTGTVIVTLPLLMTWLFAISSNRPVIDFDGAGRGSLHPASLMTLLVPNLFGVDGPLADYWGPPSKAWGELDLYIARNMSALYGGILPLMAMVVIGVGRKALFSRSAWPLLTGFVLAVLYALGRYSPFFDVFYHLPGTDLFRRPADATFYIGAYGALLGGYCLSRALNGTLRPLEPVWFKASLFFMFFWMLGAIALAFYKGQWAVAHVAVLTACLFMLGAQMLTARAIERRGHPVVMIGFVVVFMIADLGFNNGPNESTALPPADFEVLTSHSQNETLKSVQRALNKNTAFDHRDRVEIIGLGFHWPNASMVHKLDNTLGYNPLRLQKTVSATGAEDHSALVSQKEFSKLMPSYRSLLADMLGLRYIVTPIPLNELDKKASLADFPLIEKTKEAYIYENPRAFPRAMIVPQALGADQDRLIETGEWPADFNPKQQVLLSSDVASTITAGGEGTVRLRIYGTRRSVMDVYAPQGGVLVLYDVWHPWWRVYVDEEQQPLLRANGLFRAVVLKPGRHHVRFAMHPIDGTMKELRALLSKH
jgi:hypothetical protein